MLKDFDVFDKIKNKSNFRKYRKKKKESFWDKNQHTHTDEGTLFLNNPFYIRNDVSCKIYYIHKKINNINNDDKIKDCTDT